MGRAVAALARDAAQKLGIDEPFRLFGSTDRTATELRRVIIEAADKIVHAHDWQRLLTLNTITGDGTTTAWDRPDDFLRMPKESEIWSTRWQHPLAHITPEEWLHLDVREFDTIVGSWTIYGDQFVFTPALANGEQAKFWYVKDAAVITPAGATKAEFDTDTDEFLLDDRVLELVTIATWRAMKSLDYQEEAMAADMALSRAIERDKGARVITQVARRNMRTKIAYPWSIVP